MRRSEREKERRVGELMELCRARGWNVTPQRVAVYRAVLDAEDHPSPERVYRHILPEMPSLSLATVYKALDALVELGVVKEVAVGGETKRFDANLDLHQHLICTRCGKVTDYNHPALDRIAPPERITGFIPQSVQVQVLGVCRDCAGSGG